MKNCNQGKGFTNKIWNAFKLIKGWEVSDSIHNQNLQSSDRMVWAKLQQTLLEIEDNFKIQNFRCFMGIYKLVWDVSVLVLKC
jgi:valyl-tRNA synthetase